MTVTYTPNLGLTKPDFDHRGWDTDENTVRDLLEEAIAGVVSIDIDGNYTLVMTDGLSAEGRNAVIEFTADITPLTVVPIITTPVVEKLWIILNNCNKAIILSNGSGATQTVPVGNYALIYNDATDLFKVFELNASAPELGTIATVLSDKVFKEHFDIFDEALWTQFQSLGSTTAVVTADDGGNRKSAYGGSFLRVTAYAGYYFKPLPFNKDAIYKISGRLRQHNNGSAGKDVYVGLVGLAADGVTIVDKNGSNSLAPDDHCMLAARQFDLASDVPGTWTYFEGYLLGTHPTLGTEGPANDRGAPGQLHEGVRYIAPAFVVNTGSSDAICDVDSIELEIIEPANAANAPLVFDEAGMGSAPEVLAELGNLALDENILTMTEDPILVGGPEDPVNNLWKTFQLLDPNGTDRNVNLPLAMTQHLTYFIRNDGAANTLKIRVNGAVLEEINLLQPGEWVWLRSTSLTPTAKEDWEVISKSPQYRELTIDDTSPWRVPQGVRRVVVSLVGAGGGGASHASATVGGSGGGGGAYRENIAHAVVPGADIAFTVGVKGAGGGAGGVVGDAGGNTVFDTVTIEGGQGGVSWDTPGAGGHTGFSDAGGDGGDGSVSGTDAEPGGNGPYAAGGAAGTPLQDGGGGGGGSFDVGGAGGDDPSGGSNAPDNGGGGGGGASEDVAAAGGDGADGRIILRF